MINNRNNLSCKMEMKLFQIITQLLRCGGLKIMPDVIMSYELFNQTKLWKDNHPQPTVN